MARYTGPENVVRAWSRRVRLLIVVSDESCIVARGIEEFKNGKNLSKTGQRWT